MLCMLVDKISGLNLFFVLEKSLNKLHSAKHVWDVDIEICVTIACRRPYDAQPFFNPSIHYNNYSISM